MLLNRSPFKRTARSSPPVMLSTARTMTSRLFATTRTARSTLHSTIRARSSQPSAASDDVAHSVAIQADGKIVAAGYASNGTNMTSRSFATTRTARSTLHSTIRRQGHHSRRQLLRCCSIGRDAGGRQDRRRRLCFNGTNQ